MFTDILFIITTAFAFLGVYCLFETVAEMFSVSKFPPSVTVISTDNEDLAYRKIKYIEQNVPNNYIVLLNDDDGWVNQQIKNVLYVNNK